MKYRTRTDIIATILGAASAGASRTRIMYKSYLSYAQLKEYVVTLVQNGLVDFDSITQIYKTSEKGMRFLHLYEKMDGFLDGKETYEVMKTQDKIENTHTVWSSRR